MSNYIPNTFLISLVIASCGQDLDRRKDIGSADAEAIISEVKELYTFLPDRAPMESQNPNIKQLLTNYYITLSPSGDECPQTEKIESQGAYEDKKKITFDLMSSCDYTLDFFVYNTASNLAISESPNFTDSIAPIFETHCVSCHTNYNQYSNISNELDNIVVQIENGAMPPSGSTSLSDFEVATIIAWKSGGYLENNPNPISSESPLAESIGTYYRNNYNTVISSIILKVQNFVIYEDDLWLQSEGLQAGLTQNKWEIIDHSENSDNE